ncbi:hypothetical protein D9M72_636280 [compost metagenome]
MLFEKCLCTKGQIGSASLAKQVGLGKRGALIRQSTLFGNKGHVARETLLTQGGCTLEAGVSGSEYHNSLHGSATSVLEANDPPARYTSLSRCGGRATSGATGAPQSRITCF